MDVIAVGKLGEAYLRQAAEEYEKRLKAYCRLTVTQIPEYRLPDAPSPAQIQRGLEEEGHAILEKLPRGAFSVALCVEGRQLSSPELARRLEELKSAGESRAAFLIGGSWGLDEAVKKKCRLLLSMSSMTFPHQLARIMLLEQLYRAFTISAGQKYHK